ncbi:DUF2268 domain-containing protein [Metabacillus sediminilitoris]|uniref:Zn-dependent protease n=1 Tax=Metabacillus sediminilitoris TaxID=2567941 RepID=A0A4V3WF96_9BACI|nr:DUF2268 domain-containing protein [Metabacillus sediminilitoris]QGQ44657.1 Zn-dependent protease [Metabacillus sediminilitoris]THF78993.1 Zn-dependent protease [Metabacillus sediminilitoris]
MSVIDTIVWLKNASQQEEIFKKLCPYFHKLTEKEVANYLHFFGMYKNSHGMGKWIERVEKDKIITFIKDEEKKLQKEWNGPDIPIFIFPCDDHNRRIQKEYKGRSGLAFNNKLFLFLSLNTNKRDISSLFIHEYHHVCRLAAVKKQEKDFTIIDTVIMEGLAENAVREMLGENDVASWTKLYSDSQCERFLERIITPQREVSRESHKFSQLMFGTGFYPNMLGYAVGYYIVKKYMKYTGKNTKELLGLPAEAFMKDFKE